VLLSCGASDCLTMLDGVVCQYIWEFRWRAGQKHYSGTYWSATEGRHVSSTSRGWNSPGCCSQISTGRCTVAVHSRSCKRCAPRKERVSGRVELGEEEFSVVGFADGLVEELGAVERSLFDKERLDRICAADDPADLHVVAAGAAARDAHQIGAVTVDGHRGDYQALAAGGQSGRNRNLARFELPNRKTTSTGRLSRLNEALLKLVSPRRESVSRHYVRWHGNAARHVRQTHLSGK
jgi:hypothetical protein